MKKEDFKKLDLKIANEKRKEEHLEITLNKDVSFKKISSGFEGFSFIHQALPDIDMDEIDLYMKMRRRNLKYSFFFAFCASSSLWLNY